jgi:PAS domain S-box-containing protein
MPRINSPETESYGSTATPAKNFLLDICLAFTYVIVAKLSLRLAFINASASAVWPPTGLAIASLVLFGPGVWPAVFVGSFLSNISTAGTIPTSLLIATGNTLEGLLGAYFMKRFTGGMHTFTRSADVARFAILSGIIAPLVSATIGVGSLYAYGFIAYGSFGTVWLTWFLGNCGGALLVTPFLLSWWKNRPRYTLQQAAELATILGILTLLLFWVLPESVQYPYILFPVLLWLAFRFGIREITGAIIYITLALIWLTLHHSGPFYQRTGGINQALLQLQLFLGILCISKLIVAATVYERRMAQNNIATSERRFRALTEKSSDAIALVDTDTKILYASPTAQQILGYTPFELQGMTGITLVHPDDIPGVERSLSKVLSEFNQYATFRTRVRRKNDAYTWVEVTVRNLIDDPAIGAMVVNFRDITERLNLEIAKDEFLTIAAHQLRSPLGLIRWNLEYLMKKSTIPQEVISKHLKLVYTYTLSLIGLADELVEVARLISGSVSPSPTATDIVPLVEQELELIMPEAEKNNLQVTFHRPEYTAKAHVDPKRFGAVIGNIFTNAIKYTPKNGRIEISISKSHKQFRVRVRDTGIGIPRAEQQVLFTKFYRASNAKQVKTEGTGLGLFIVKTYVQQWGGTVKLTSPPEGQPKGTEITFTLPAAIE